MKKDLFGIPIEHMTEDPLPLELRNRLRDSIIDIYNSREWWLEKEPERAKWWRQLSYFNEKGQHVSETGEDSMRGVDGWDEMKAIITPLAVKYFESISHYPYIDLLREHWHIYGWWMVCDEKQHLKYHHHAQHCVIGNYYVQKEPEHAPMKLKSPLDSLIISSTPGVSKIPSEVVLDGKTGDCIFWPGWVEHEVPGTDTLIYRKGEAQGGYIHNPNNKYDKLRVTIVLCFVDPSLQFGYKLTGKGVNIKEVEQKRNV